MATVKKKARAKPPKIKTHSNRNGAGPRWIWHFQIENRIADTVIADWLGVEKTTWRVIKSKGHDLPTQPGWPKIIATKLRSHYADEVKHFLKKHKLKNIAYLFMTAPKAPTQKAVNLARAEMGRRAVIRKGVAANAMVINMRRQDMSTKALRHFGFKQNPFNSEINGAADIFRTAEFNDIKEELAETARGGGIAALVGESGSGKTTLMNELKEELAQGNVVKIISPKALNQSKITPGSLLYAIIADLGGNPVFSHVERMSREAIRMMTAVLEQHKRVCVVIEDAHRLKPDCLFYLKSFIEMKHGYKNLVSFILLAQQELEALLDETAHPQLRQIIRRVSIHKMNALNGSTEKYLKHKFSRIGVDVNDVMTAAAVKEIKRALNGTNKRNPEEDSRCYPLLLQNIMTVSMNYAARIGAKTVDEEIVEAAIKDARI